MVQSQPRQIVHETLSGETQHKKGLEEWFKVKALSSSSSMAKKKKKTHNKTNHKTEDQLLNLEIHSEKIGSTDQNVYANLLNPVTFTLNENDKHWHI
jgi:hypothetical protein